MNKRTIKRFSQPNNNGFSPFQQPQQQQQNQQQNQQQQFQQRKAFDPKSDNTKNVQDRNHQSDEPRKGHQNPSSCTFCKNPASMVCERCEDFYCSTACQEQDFPTHRYICFQMPKLVSVNSKFPVENCPPLSDVQKRNSPRPAPSKALSPEETNETQTRSPAYPAKNNQSDGAPRFPKQINKQMQPTANSVKENVKPREPIKSDWVQKESANVDANDPMAGLPKNNSKIIICSFRSSNRLCIRSAEKEDDDDFMNTMRLINEFGRVADPLKRLPPRNSYAITDFNNDGLFYRVQVMSAFNENEIQVLYVDYGNEATKKLKDLKEIPKECAELKQHLAILHLHNVPHFKLTTNLREFTKQFEDVDGTVVYPFKNKYCIINLSDTKESLNDKLQAFCKTLQNEDEHPIKKEPVPEKPMQSNFNTNKKVTTPPSAQKDTSPEVGLKLPVQQKPTSIESLKNRQLSVLRPTMEPPFETILLPHDGKNLKVMIVDNSQLFCGCFGCILVEDKGNLQSIQVFLAKYNDQGRVYKPKVDEYCLAKYEDVWYRAKALNLTDTHVEVILIDFLNVAVLTMQDIRRYPANLTNPCKTSLCMIDVDIDALQLDEEVTEALKNTLQIGSEHKIDEVMGVEEDKTSIVYVKMSEISELLN